MESYDLPAAADGLEPGAAKAEINRVLADSRENPEHPMMDKNHPQHADFISGVQRLQVAVNPPLEPAEPLDDAEREEIEAEIRMIENTSGFGNGTLRRVNRGAHDSLVARRSDLYERLSPPGGFVQDEEEVPDADEGMTVQQSLYIEAEVEMDRLVALGFTPADIPPDVNANTVNALRLQRLHAEGNEDELEPLMSQELRRLGMGPELRSALLATTIAWIYNQNG